MKHIKTILAATIASLSISQAFAVTDYIAGSTSFRKAANAAISAWVESQGGVAGQNGIIYCDQNAASGPQGATDIVWSYNDTVNGDAKNRSYIIAHWSGGELGFQITASTQTTSFLNLSAASALLYSNPILWSNFKNSAPTTATPVTGYTAQSSANICFTDTKQTSSYFHGTYAGVNYVNLTSANGSYPGVAISTYVFLTSNAAPSDVTNISADSARLLFATGYLNGGFLSGNSADNSYGFWLIGRDIDAAAREQILGIIGYGVFKPVQQYVVTAPGSIQLSPAATIDGIREIVGNGGYSSGSSSSSSGLVYNIINYGNLGTNALIGGTTSQFASGNYLLGYSGTGDAGTPASPAVNCRILSYNGVSISNANIQQGQYPLWGYENIFYNSTTATPNTINFATQLAQNILNTTTANLYGAGIQLSTMSVARSIDFGTISSLIY